MENPTTIMLRRLSKYDLGGQDRWNVRSLGSGGTTAVAMLMQAQYPNGYLLITAHYTARLYYESLRADLAGAHAAKASGIPTDVAQR